ncbi:MAG: type II toxin-antitoxin system HigB family toxin [Bryobacteraceae bacterium]
MNVISKTGLADLLQGKSQDVQKEAVAWYALAKSADWPNLAAVRTAFPDADLVGGLLVFNIRRNRYRLIVYPVFSRRRLYIKALFTHKGYETKDWKNQWP